MVYINMSYKDHDDHHDHKHGHSHGLVDESIVRSKEGVRAVSLSLTVLLLTTLLQLWLYGATKSVALLTDVIHNGGDALTAIPLGLAFYLKSKKGERYAGYFVVAIILVSAIVATVQVVEKFINLTTPTHLWALFLAGIIGIVGNEMAAIIRWRAGKKLDSPALIADGTHARADGIVSGGVVLSTIFIALGFPIADPIIGSVIIALILHSTWEAWQTVRSSE